MSKTPWILSREMFLDEAELSALLRTLAAEVQRATGEDRTSPQLDLVIVAGLALSGLRNSEFCQLTLGDVEVSSKRPCLRVVGTRSEDRNVFIPLRLARLLKDYISGARKRSLPPGIDPRDLKQRFILTERGRPFDRTTLYRRVVRILSARGLESRASVQLLRHTYGYLAYKQTAGNLLFVQRQLGHAHPMVTAIYEQFSPQDYSEVANRISIDVAD